MMPKADPLRRMALVVAAALSMTAPVAAQTPVVNDYPTVARADYVFGCMSSNGETREILEKCSCSIDHIARLLPYERYVSAETILRTLQVGGEKVAPLRASARHKAMVADMRRAQIEADILCFQ
ncbi:hypothetical protein [Marinibacterium profundimaris]|uniref:hypothetical protein n=1 Tax=Marinibacterium profundimaris TaxID=1679460 RepID=UPI001E2A5D6C|nr:hypothetical protein [Marinibacterium profundimaris]